MAEQKKFRVNVYIDGFNFYYGLKSKHWRKFYWLDIVKFYELFMKPDQELVNVFYCIAAPTDVPQKNRQSLLFSANRLNPKFKVIYGKFLEKEVTHGGKKFKTFEEKQTDINIAVNLIKNVVFNNCDTSIIVSGDSDLVPAINLVKEINSHHKVFVHFPPNRHSANLTSKSDAVIHLDRYENRFQKCILDEEIIVNPHLTIKKPPSWK